MESKHVFDPDAGRNETVRPLTFSVFPSTTVFEIPPAELKVVPGAPRELIDVLRDFERRVKSGYTSGEVLRYHNWEGHISDLRMFGLQLCDRCETVGLPVDRLALVAAILGHDTLLTFDERLIGMTSKEQLASFYSYNLLRELGAPEVFARKVEGIINATHVKVEPVTTEQKIMRAIDVRNVGGPYEEFWPNTVKLYEEARNLSGREMSFEQFVNGSLMFLSEFFPLMIQLTPDALDGDGRSRWHMGGLSNVMRLFKDSRALSGGARCIVDFPLREAHETVVSFRGLRSGEILIGVGSPDIIKGAQNLLSQCRAKGMVQGLAFFVPGESEAAPVPTGIAHEVHARCIESRRGLTEALRILHPDGVLYLYGSDPKITRYLLQRGFSPLEKRIQGDEQITLFARNLHGRNRDS